MKMDGEMDRNEHWLTRGRVRLYFFNSAQLPKIHRYYAFAKRSTGAQYWPTGRFADEGPLRSAGGEWGKPMQKPISPVPNGSTHDPNLFWSTMRLEMLTTLGRNQKRMG